VPRNRNRLISAAAVIVIIAGLKAGRPILIPVLVAAFLTVLAAPTVLWLRRKRVPGVVGVGVVMLALVTILALFAGLLTTAVGGFNEALPSYQAALGALYTKTLAALSDYGLDLSTTSLESFSPSSAVEFLGGAISGVVAALSSMALVLIIVVFLVLEVAGFPRKLRAALDDPNANLGRWGAAITDVQRYLAIKTAICVATGGLIALWLWVIGVDFPILWGLVAFMLNYIPSIGSVVAAVPAILVALVQPDLGPGSVVLATLGYVVVNGGLGNFLEPQLMGRRFGLSPLVVFLSLIFWGWVWGPVGMLLSVPLTMVTRIVLERTESTRWVAILLSPAPREA
jgi:predicted PurR-regulated permease PerM